MEPGGRNIFSFHDQTPFGAWGHGRAFATGAYRLSANFHRGVDLDASVDVEAGVGGDAQLADGVRASLNGGGKADAGLSLRAAFPVDLFGEAGLVARFDAQAEAAVWVRAELDVDAGLFAADFAQSLPAPWGRLASVFMKHVEIGAGLWGKASVSAEILGDAVFAGSLLPVGDEDPGFTFALNCDAGLAFGAGLSGLANVTMSDPRKMLDELGSVMVDLIAAELDRSRRGLADPVAADTAMSYVRFILPLAIRSAYAAGVATVASPGGQARDSAGSGLAHELVRQGQGMLLDAVFSLGLKELRQLVGEQSLLQRIEALSDREKDALLSALAGLDGGVWGVLYSTVYDQSQLFSSIIALIDNLGTLLDTALFTLDESQAWTEHLALIWAAASLAQRVLSIRADGSDGPGTDPFPATVVAEQPSAGVVAACVAARVGCQVGSITMGDLILFLIQEAGLEERLAEVLSDLSPALALIADVVREASSSGLVASLLRDLSAVNQDTTAALLRGVAGPIADAVTNHVIPDLLDLLPRGGGAELLLFGAVRPALTGLLQITLASIPHLGDSTANRIYREQLSAVLLRVLGPLATQAASSALNFGLDDGAARMRELAGQIDGGDRSEIIDPIVQTWAKSPLALLLDTTDVSAMLRLMADALERWNNRWREQVVSQVRRIVTLGAQDGDQIATIWDRLKQQDDNGQFELLPMADAVGTLTTQLMGSVWDLFVNVLVPGAVRILANHLLRIGAKIGEAIAAAVEEGIRAAEQAVQWLGGEAQQLEDKAVELAQTIDQTVADMAGALATLAAGLEADLDADIIAVRDRGWGVIQSVLEHDWLFEHLPDRGDIEADVKKLYEAIFAGIRYLLDGPLATVSNVADWLHDDLVAQAASGVIDADALLRGTRRVIQGTG